MQTASDIPSRMIEGCIRYILFGILPGDFLTAVFSNNLVMSFGRADDENAIRIRAYADLLYNHSPVECWGSLEKMKSWYSDRRINGQVMPTAIAWPTSEWEKVALKMTESEGPGFLKRVVERAGV